MKATLEFTLPDEAHAHLLAIRSGELYAALCEFGEYLRSQEKYVEPEDRDDLIKVRRMWFEVVGDLMDLP